MHSCRGQRLVESPVAVEEHLDVYIITLQENIYKDEWLFIAYHHCHYHHYIVGSNFFFLLLLGFFFVAYGMSCHLLYCIHAQEMPRLGFRKCPQRGCLAADDSSN